MSSLLPFLLNDLLEESANRPTNLFDQHFGVGLLNDDLLQPSVIGPLRLGYYRPWRSQAAQHSGVSNIKNDCEGFKVNLDVQQFKPSELEVKMVDNFVVIEGKHEERQDEHGYVSRQFTRRYKIPDNVDAESIVSQLSSDGILTISAPKKAIEASGNERVVPIKQTMVPAVKSSGGKGDANQDKMES